MLMSKDDFKKAFREAVSSEFSQIPCDEDSIDFTFSERFNKKMRKLIKSQRKSYYFLINTAAKRVAVVFMAILTLFTASMSIKAIREPVVKFIVEVYESFTRYFCEGDTADEIEKEYIITELPVGYSESNKFKSNNSITTIFEDKTGNKIEFVQGTSNNAEFILDSEHSNVQTVYIGNEKIELYEWDEMACAFWTKEGYVFNLIYNPDSVTISEIEKVILNIR